MIFLFIIYLLIILSYTKEIPSSINCQPIYVKWPRVKLNNQINSSSIIENNLTFSECQNYCNLEINPSNKNNYLQCSAINYFVGLNNYSNICQLFSSEYVQHTDGYMEADDRFTFYWKFCVETSKRCNGDYAFTFFSDRYMLSNEVNQIKFTQSLEECLGECLNNGKSSKSIICRSVSFNRTDGGCHLSTQNQFSKPTAIHINNNPNYRIDYYENNCYNNNFTFISNCEPSGIRITVDSLIPYSGALYGLYDFFSCRVEPKEQQHFELFFPYPNFAKNCSDSMRKIEDDIFLEVVLSTDGVEPLYFITSDDLTYQARCPAPNKQKQIIKESYLTNQNENITTSTIFPIIENFIKNNYTKGNSINAILEELANSAKINEENKKIKSEIENLNQNKFPTTKTTIIPINNLKEKTKKEDIFSLPLYSILQNELSDIEKTNKNETKNNNLFIPPIISTNNNNNTNTLLNISTTQSTTTTKNQPSEIEIDTTMITFPSNFESKGPQINGMESFFEEDENNNKINSSTKTPQIIKTTTKRSIYENNNFENKNNKEFSFSTHLAFSPDKIFISTGGNNDYFNKTQTITQIPIITKKLSINEEKEEKVYSKMELINENKKEIIKEENKLINNISEINKSEFEKIKETTKIFNINEIKKEKEQKEIKNENNLKTNKYNELPLPPSNSTSQESSTLITKSIDGSPPSGDVHPPTSFGGNKPSSTEISNLEDRRGTQREKVIFEVFHNGQPADAVVVGSRITLSFTPYFAIPPSHMSISGCQVEPIGSLYDWEKEPLAIVKDGCQADHVGLVCPPQKTDYGIRVTVEAFRYQTTTQIQYTCLIRICPFAPCPQTNCPSVEGCPGDDIVSRTLGSFGGRKRYKRSKNVKNNIYRRDTVHWLAGSIPQKQKDQPFKMSSALQQQLILLGGDSLVRRRLIVVNSDDELRYYTRTGEIPQIRPGFY
ncbi:hypothetical protein ACQ4LE_002611 [Meloidogyne hapla]